MGDRVLYQALTRQDRISVLLYRGGIVVASIALCGLGFLVRPGAGGQLFGESSAALLWTGLLVDLLMVGTGISAVFIHLYVSAFHRFLKRLYGVALVGWVILLLVGAGNPAAALAGNPAYGYLLLPVAGCLGFVTAKEAFCFQFTEGYLLALLLPATIIFGASGGGATLLNLYWLAVLAALFVLFTVRKVFMPIHVDIGDKSAYH